MRIEVRNGIEYKLHDPIKEIPFYKDWLQKLLDRSAAYQFTEPEINPDTGLKTGKILTKTKPYDRHMEQAMLVTEDGQTGIVCIGCGEPFFDVIQSVCKDAGERILRTKKSRKLIRGIPSARVYDRIRIGGLIQMPVEEVLSRTEVEVKYRMQPVFRQGVGCPTCQAKYQEAVKAVSGENEASQEIAFIQAKRHLAKQQHTPIQLTPVRQRCLHGLPRVEFCSVCSKRVKTTFVPSKQFRQRTPFIDVFQDNQGHISEE